MSSDVTVREVLRRRMLNLGLYDEARVEELVSRVEKNEQAMLALLGRLVVEEARGGSGVQQGIRALVNSSAIPEALDTYNRLLVHELDDESFPVVGPAATRKKK